MDFTLNRKMFSPENSENLSYLKTVNGGCYSTESMDLCNLENSLASYGTVIFGTVAAIENLTLVFALANWRYKKQFKIFWFLWHLSVVDFLLASVFVFYYLRKVAACPKQYVCLAAYEYEGIIIFVFFFWTIMTSNVFVLAIVVDRFVAIMWPFKYSDIISTRRARFVAGFTWILPLLVVTANAIGIGASENKALFYSIETVLGSSITLFCSFATVVLNAIMLIYVWCSVKSDSNNALGSKLAVTLAVFVASSVISSAPWSTALLLCNGFHTCRLHEGPDYFLMLVLLHAFTSPLLYGYRVAEVKLRVVKFWKHYFTVFMMKFHGHKKKGNVITTV